MNTSLGRSITRSRWLLMVLALTGLLVGGLLSLIQRPVYSASAKVFVSVQQATSVQDLTQGSTFTQQVVRSYASVVSTPIVLLPVIERLRLSTTWTRLSDQVTASVPTDTQVLEITATSDRPQLAAAIANAASDALSSVSPQLTPAAAGENGSAVKITSIQEADVPTMPEAPRPFVNLVAGLILGILVGLAIAIARERFDVRIRSASEAAAISEVALLGVFPYEPALAETPLVVEAQPRSQTAEAYRTLRTNLRFMGSGHGVKSLVVTSSVEGEGKSTCSANLAIAVANTGARVALVDADLRRPRVSAYFGVDASTGLTDVLVDTVDLADALQPWGASSLSVMPAGTIPPNPSELLQSDSMTELLARLSLEYDLLIVDAPPLLPVTDAAILAEKVGGALVVCALGKTQSPQLRASMETLSRINARTLGIVTRANSSDRGTSSGWYGYSPQYATPVGSD